MNTAIVETGKTDIQVLKIRKSKEKEAAAAAHMAWAKEQGDYEAFANAWYAYVLQRRETTELCKPFVSYGGNGSNQYESKGDTRVTLADIGFTKKQWNRRVEEWKIPLKTVNDYFDEIIAYYDWHPSLAGLVKFHNGAHSSYNSGENEWHTPPAYITAARKVLGEIELDPASSVIANRTVKAAKFYSKSDDGLAKTWKGKTWLNPPYAGELIQKFISKFVEHVSSGDIPEGIVLVNNSTETEWFDELVSVASAVVFPRGRVRFLDPRGNPGTPLQGQAVVYAGKNVKKFIAEFGEFGWSAYVQSR